MASWLVCSSPDRAVWVRALAGDIALCSLARHFTLTALLSTQVYKWVPANLILRVTLQWGVEILSLHATETGIGFGLMSHYELLCILYLPFPLSNGTYLYSLLSRRSPFF